MEEGILPSSIVEGSLPSPASSEGATATASGSTGAPGGPLFMPGFVSGLTNARRFQGSCASLLITLQAELNDASIPADDLDILVDDLKIVSDKELVNTALEKAIQENNLGELGSRTSESGPALALMEKQEGTSFCYEQSLIGSQGILRSISGCCEIEEMNEIRQDSNLYGSVTLSDRGGRYMDLLENGERSMDSSFSAGVQAEWENSSFADADGHGSESSFASTKPKLGNGLCSFARDALGNHSESVPDLRGIPAQENWKIKDRTESSDACNKGTAVVMENILGGNQLLQKRHALKKTKMKGRPFDRNLRAAEWQMDGTLLEESYLTRLRMERENAKTNTTLNSLRVKMEQEGMSAPLDNLKSLQALNVLVSPLRKVTTMVATADRDEEILPFEVVLWIEVYHSRLPHRRRKAKSQEFLVLGSQKLTALRDKIYCLTDELMRRAHTHVPSGYFLIENVFYNDLRDARAIDYSLPIIEWVNKQRDTEQSKAVGDNTGKKQAGKSNKFNSLQSADMATTDFLDLQFRVGMQYIYCHQGDCKHAIVIRDMRLVHKEDAQNMLLYPLLRSPFRVRHRKCSICRIYRAKKVTYDDKMAPGSPCFFCDYCYYMLHYSPNGTLLYSDFKVYDYYHE